MTEQQTAELATMLLRVLHGYDENAIFDALSDLVRTLPKGARARRHLLKLVRDQRHEQMRSEIIERECVAELDKALTDWLLTGGLI